MFGCCCCCWSGTKLFPINKLIKCNRNSCVAINQLAGLAVSWLVTAIVLITILLQTNVQLICKLHRQHLVLEDENNWNEVSFVCCVDFGSASQSKISTGPNCVKCLCCGCLIGRSKSSRCQHDNRMPMSIIANEVIKLPTT